MKVLTAKVLYTAGKAYPSKQPDRKPRQSVKLKLSDTREVSVWFDEGDINHCSLKKGQNVQVLVNNDKFMIMFDDDATPTVVPPTSVPANSSQVSPTSEQAIAPKVGEPTKEMKYVIATGLRYRADLLRTCHVRVQASFTTEDGNVVISESTIQKYAQLLFMDLRGYWQE